MIPPQEKSRLCIHCGDKNQGECQGWNPPSDQIKELMPRVAELEAAAKLALDALNFAPPLEQDYLISIQEFEVMQEAAIAALKKAGIE